MMKPRQLIYAVGVLFITVIIMFVSAIIYANRVADSAREGANRAIVETQQALCVLINDIYQGQQQEPPQAESGKEFAERISSLRQRFDCA